MKKLYIGATFYVLILFAIGFSGYQYVTGKMDEQNQSIEENIIETAITEENAEKLENVIKRSGERDHGTPPIDFKTDKKETTDDLLFTTNGEAMSLLISKFSISELMNIANKLQDDLTDEDIESLKNKVKDRLTDEELEALKVIGMSHIEKILQ